MPTVTITVFEDIKNAFNMGLGRQNKSAVIADLMRDAVDLEQRRKLHCNAMQCNAVDRILANRINATRFSEGGFGSAREENRP